MNTEELELLLKLAEEAGSDTSEACEYMSKLKKSVKEAILAAHLEKYNIYFCESDGRYHSYLPDETRPKNRKPIAKKTREELEEAIVTFYLSRDEQEKEQKETEKEEVTLEKYFPIWLKVKGQETGNSNYMKRIHDDWKHYYLNDPIIHKPLLSMKVIELKGWAHDKILTNHLTKKQYINMSIIIRQVYDYLVELEMIPINPYRQFKVNNKIYTMPPKKTSETEVFNEDEEKLVKAYLLGEYYKNPFDITPLAILLNFYLGLRIGELAAIKKGDLLPDRKYIHIQWMEARQFRLTPEGKCVQYVTVVPHTKTDQGDRFLYLVPQAREILDMILEYDEKHGLGGGPDDCIFYNRNGDPLRTWTIAKCYRKTCNALNIIRKSNHKVRKTCITKLADNPNINLKYAMEFAGHKDVQIFIENYCFSRYSQEKTQMELEKTLSS